MYSAPELERDISAEDGLKQSVSDPYSIESGSGSRRPLNPDPSYFLTLSENDT